MGKATTKRMSFRKKATKKRHLCCRFLCMVSLMVFLVPEQRHYQAPPAEWLPAPAGAAEAKAGAMAVWPSVLVGKAQMGLALAARQALG